MRRVTLTVVAILLAVPAAASAKVGIEFERDPATVKPGDRMSFNIMIMREATGPNGDLTMDPIVGAYPLVRFNSASGELIQVRGARSNRDGISRGSVAFPDKGPWTGTLHVPGEKLGEGGGNMGSWSVGEPLGAPAPNVVETVSPPAGPTHSTSGSSGLWMGWILLGGAAGLGSLGFTAVRMGIPSRLRTRLGGGA